MKKAGVQEISIKIKGVGVIPLNEPLLIQFLTTIRGNKVDSMMGTYVRGLRDLANIRKEEST